MLQQRTGHLPLGALQHPEEAWGEPSMEPKPGDPLKRTRLSNKPPKTQREGRTDMWWFLVGTPRGRCVPASTPASLHVDEMQGMVFGAGDGGGRGSIVRC